MALYLIGLGLGDEKDITLRGLEAMKQCDKIYIESFTSRLCSHDIKKMEQFAGMVLEEGAEPKLETRTKGDTSRSFEQLVVEATGKDGVVDLAKIEAMSEGRQHDVTSGPCKCGAWH